MGVSRDMTAAAVAEAFGLKARSVQIWADRVCPHTREKRVGGGRNELWFSMDEVKTWMDANGRDTSRMALFREAGGEASDAVWAGLGEAGGNARISDADLLRYDSGQLLLEAKREVINLIQKMRRVSADSATLAVKQLTESISQISKEERLHADRVREEEDRRGRVIERAKVRSVLEAVGGFIRQSLAASSTEVPFAVIAAMDGQVDPTRVEALQRLLAAKLRVELDKVLAAMAGQLEQAAAELGEREAGTEKKAA